MKDKYLIGEVCKLFNTTRDTLVHYEKLGLISPKKDDNNGYRYYDIEDLNCLTDILFLKKLNLPLTDIKKAIKNSTPSDILEIIKDKEKHLQEEMKKLKELEKTLRAMKLNVKACINNLNKLEIREEKENLLFIEIAKKNNFNDFIDIIEGMVNLVEGVEVLNKNFLEYINFTFLIEEGGLFEKDGGKKVKWGVTLRQSYKFSEDIILNKKVEFIPKNKYIYTVLVLDDTDYDDWLERIKDIVLENNIKVGGPILGRMMLTEYDNDVAMDYYEVYIPIK
ncbi:MerR family transcriptional regulator [Romboutsia sp.]|uniref:MerR family transcriptional regulator n=1 Tax=Romboutsia sp. TaxID=1965302 RepID=UPI003F343A80